MSAEKTPMTFNRFSTDPFPLDQRSAAWGQALAAMGLGAEQDSLAPEGMLLRYRAPLGMDLALLLGGPQRLFRARDAGIDRAWLGTLLDGTARLSGGDTVHRRDLLHWPNTSGPLLAPIGRFRLLLLRLPPGDARWGGLADSKEENNGAPIRLGTPPVLTALLAAMAEAMLIEAETALAALEVALAEIMPPALGLFAARGAKRTATLRRHILRAIDRQLDDAQLTLIRFAETEGVSVRAVQKLLEAEGRSFRQYLRHRRLEKASDALRDLLRAEVPITDIGFQHGFPDPAHFSRAFRRQYGLAPTAYRLAAQARGQSAATQVPRSRGHPQSAARHEALASDSADPTFEPRPNSPTHHHLRATPRTVHWGYFSSALAPVLTVRSGDTVTVETLTQHASDDPARMIAGDPDAEAVFHWTRDRKAIDRRGAGPMDASMYGRGAGEGFGVHILTGPIMVEEARPGDVLEIEFLDIAMRPSRAPEFEGRSFGSNAAVWWGRQYDDLVTAPAPREVVTLYEICTCAGRPCAHAVYSYRWTPQRDPDGVMHDTIDYPGVIVDFATIEPRHDVLAGLHIPVRPHFGTIGVAPDHPGLLDSIPPSAFGGNLDNWRIGAGTKLFLPVSLRGALLSLGDPHAAQGDGEVSGTAIECSLTGTLGLHVHARETAEPMLRDLSYPLIETPDSWIVQGFSHPDYLSDLGEAAQSEVYKRSSLDGAMRDAFRKARRFLMTAHRLSEDEAVSLLSVAVDFGITQVVDGNWGAHATIPKAIFQQ
jgi:acetamidase/formamidase/AraC-like DNA-binding protein